MSSFAEAVSALLGRFAHLEGPSMELLARVQLRRRIKQALERERIPFPHRVVYVQSKAQP